MTTARSCSRCRQTLKPFAVFCPRCGVSISAAPLSSQSPPLPARSQFRVPPIQSPPPRAFGNAPLNYEPVRPPRRSTGPKPGRVRTMATLFVLFAIGRLVLSTHTHSSSYTPPVNPVAAPYSSQYPGTPGPAFYPGGAYPPAAPPSTYMTGTYPPGSYNPAAYPPGAYPGSQYRYGVESPAMNVPSSRYPPQVPSWQGPTGPSGAPRR